jgi:hypothetical protein
MRPRHLLGLTGSLVLALGVFMPILSVPIVGSVNYFRNGEGDGTLVLVLALVSLLLTLRYRYEWLLTTGLTSLAMLVFTFVNLRIKISGMNADIESQLAGNPFRGLADIAIQSVQIQWGWIVLVIGSALLVAAASLRQEPTQNLRRCPLCAELIRSEARICKHCRSELPSDEIVQVAPSQAQPVFSRRVIIVTLTVLLVVPAVGWGPSWASGILTHCDWRAFACVWD